MSDYSNVVTWVLVVLGWVLVHYLTTVRERRKEVAEIVSALIDRIYELEERAVKFHSANTFDDFGARAIVTDVTRIAMDLVTPPFSVFGIAPERVKRMRQSMTYWNFEAARFSPQSATSDLIGKIGSTTDDLARAVRKKYHDRYYRHWWQFLRG